MSPRTFTLVLMLVIIAAVHAGLREEKFMKKLCGGDADKTAKFFDVVVSCQKQEIVSNSEYLLLTYSYSNLLNPTFSRTSSRFMRIASKLSMVRKRSRT